MSVLSLSKLNVSYQNNSIIKQLDLEIKSGEIVALFGPSGGGKSTVLKAVAGLLEQVDGEIVIAGNQVLSERINVPAEKRKIGLIFQDYALFPHLTVAENIGFGLDKMPKAVRADKVNELLRLIKMTDCADKYPHQISGGQQQRIAIVRALACNPSLLLFDEAFSNIDPQFRFELIADIRNLLKKQNIAALFVTHNQDEAFAFCDRIAVLNEGKIEQIDDAEHLFNHPKTRFIAEFLGEGLWLRTTVKSPTLLSSELGELQYRGEQDLAELVGKAVDVYLRPHQLKLIPEPNSNVVVEKERFVGEFYESIINWFGQSIKVKTVQSFANKAVVIAPDTQVLTVFSEVVATAN